MSDSGLYRTPFGDTLRWVAGEETQGTYSVLERTAPAGARSPGHRHRRSEAFYVLDGTLSFTIGGATIEASPGSFLIAPDGVSHGWSVTGDAPARLLLIFSPAADRAYFADMDALVRAGQADDAALARLMQEHGWM